MGGWVGGRWVDAERANPPTYLPTYPTHPDSADLLKEVEGLHDRAAALAAPHKGILTSLLPLGEMEEEGGGGGVGGSIYTVNGFRLARR